MRPFALSLFALSLLGCAGGGGSPGSPRTAAATTSHAPSPREESLERVARIHGGAGPWAVAGYRMGEFALARLGLGSGSFDLEIVHYTPRLVQYSCVADGAAAATGASLGKLNLALQDAEAADVHTVYRRKSTGQSLTLRPSPFFVAHYANVPREKLADAGREVIGLPDEKVFEIVP
jgi:formylmethanofuran dehydrogenase subunit E